MKRGRHISLWQLWIIGSYPAAVSPASPVLTVIIEIMLAHAGIAKFDERTAHLVMAAADYVIIPSRFEPCGLVAQSAARYGAVPIVTAVGGLKDFVTDEVRCDLTSTSLENV